MSSVEFALVKTLNGDRCKFPINKIKKNLAVSAVSDIIETLGDFNYFDMELALM